MEPLDDAVEFSTAEIADGLQLLGQIQDIQLLGLIEGIVDFADTAEQFTAIISAGIVLALFISFIVRWGTSDPRGTLAPHEKR
jgi:hypothetical protein